MVFSPGATSWCSASKKKKKFFFKKKKKKKKKNNRSTFRLTGRAPSSSRNDGSGPSSGCSTASRSVGTARISEWVMVLTSAHHTAAASFAVVRSSNGCCVTIRSCLA